jgi:hypothetical protein
MAIELIGAGFGRTGTLSLKFALERLGFEKCYHMIEVHDHPEHRAEWLKLHRGEPIDWGALFDGYRASVDWPACNFWREQMAQYPRARVILTLRDPENWYDSVMATIYRTSSAALEDEDPDVRYAGQWAHEVIWDAVFDGRMEDRDYVISVFNRHNDTVRAEVPAEKLLVFEASLGWEPLCEFLGAPVPDEPYPLVNTKKQFMSRERRQRD